MGGSKMDIHTKMASVKSTPLQKLAFIAVLVSTILLPIVFQGMGQQFMVRIFAVVGLYVMLALGLNIVVGFAGLLDLGYIAFYAIGAYIGVFLPQLVMVNDAARQYADAGGTLPAGFNFWSVFFWTEPMQQIAADPSFSGAIQQAAQSNPIGPWLFFLCIPLAAIGAALTGVMLGTPVLRLRGDYLAIVTLGFGEIVRILLNNNVFGLTNGAAGLPRSGIVLPKPAGLQWLQDNAYFSVGENFNFTFTSNVYWYYVIFFLVLATIFVVRRLDDSRLGRSWVAMREDEVAASAMGVNITKAKLWAFSLGALWGGIAGTTFANFQGFVSPESFTFMESVFVVCVVVIGGMGSISGAIMGAIIIQGVPELIRGFASAGIINLSATQVTAISNYRNLIFGLVLVIMMAVRPQGIFPSKRRARELHPDDEKMADDGNQTLWEAQHDQAVPGEDL